MMRTKKQIRDFIGQQDSSIATLAASPFLASVTGMCNYKGVPDGDLVKKLLSWSFWRVNGVFDEQLFRSFSSLFSGKGLPKESDVQAMLAWPVWQVNGVFCKQRFRSFASMLTGRGTPKEQDVNALLSWSVWQVNGEFSYELFRAFSSMFNSKGLPKEGDVKAVLSWSCWLLNGQFSLRLFRSFSGMCNGKGLPKEQDVNALLSWPVWQVDGEFSYELFRSFSSMFAARGLPTEADVKAFLSKPVWQVKGEFNAELFRSFSSTFHGKEKPKWGGVQAILSWPVWQVNGEFNHEIFRSFAAMCSGNELPKEADVKAVLAWPVWQVGGQFSSELFCAFSSMLAGRGLPKEEDANAMLSRRIWQVDGAFQQDLFVALSSLFHGRGLPEDSDVATCMAWLSQAGGIDRETLKLIRRLFCRVCAGHGVLGLPPVGRLRDYKQRLAQLFEGTVINDGQYTTEIKQIALFLACSGGTNYLTWPECERFLKVCLGALYTDASEVPAPPTALALTHLHRVLLAHGGRGIRTFFTVNDDRNWTSSASEREQQLVLLSLPVSLELIRGAFDRVAPELWGAYIYFGCNRTTPPDYGQWHEICDWYRVLPERISIPCSQRQFIDIAVRLPDNLKKRLMNKMAVEAVITLFPSIRILRTLAGYYSSANVAELFCAALDYVQNQQYDAATLTTLLPALLQSRLTLPSTAPKALPYHTFMNGERCKEGTIIHCPADVADGETLLHCFVATLTAIASDMSTTFAGESYTVGQYGGERFDFVVPKCTVGLYCLTISNWSLEHFKRFFDVAGTPEFYRAKPNWQEGLGSRQQLGEATFVDDSGDRSFAPLPLSTLALIVKNGAPIHRWAWLSFSQQRHRLSESICQSLLSRALTAADEVPTDFLGWLQNRDRSQRMMPPQSDLAAHSLTAPVVAEENFAQLWAALANKTLLDGADLALLNNGHNQLSLEQLVSVVERASLALPADTQEIWGTRLTLARQQRSCRNPLLLDLDLDDDMYTPRI